MTTGGAIHLYVFTEPTCQYGSHPTWTDMGTGESWIGILKMIALFKPEWLENRWSIHARKEIIFNIDTTF